MTKSPVGRGPLWQRSARRGEARREAAAGAGASPAPRRAHVRHLGNIRIIGCTMRTDCYLFDENLRDAAMRTACDLVVSGHTQVSLGAWRGAVRYLSNPAGYASENPQFNSALVVEVAHA